MSKRVFAVQAAFWLLAVCCGSLVLARPAHAQETPEPTQGTPEGAPSPGSAVFLQPRLESTALPARLSDAQGAVRISRPRSAHTGAGASAASNSRSSASIQAATINTPVLAGMQVETGDDGRAELQFDDGSLARLTPNSALLIVSLSNSGEQLRAVRGLTYYEQPPGSPSALLVQAGLDQARLGDDSLLRVDLDTNPYRAAVLRGSAHFNNKSSDIGFEVKGGETATLDPTSPSDYDIKQDVASESWDGYNADRDSALGQLAENQTNARAGDGLGDAPAWNDLDYYGTWYDVPGAGMAWSPDGVDASFDPYGAGSWDYAGTAGYSWVSDYPWGWLPYHCGGWSHFNNFGWMWQPGSGCGGFAGGGGWYPYTGLHHAPADYHLPAPPRRLPGQRTPATLPRSEPLQGSLSRDHDRRLQQYQFRQLGANRPEPRRFALDPDGDGQQEGGVAYAPVLPVYRGGRAEGYRQPLRSGFSGGGLQRGGTGQRVPQTGVIALPSQQTITPPPRVLAAPRNAIITPAPLPRQAAPPPPPARSIAPPPGVVTPSAGPVRAH